MDGCTKESGGANTVSSEWSVAALLWCSAHNQLAWPPNASASGIGTDACLTCQLHAGAPRQGPPHQLPQVLGLGVPPEPVYQPVGAVLHQDDLVVWPQPLLRNASKVAAGEQGGRGAGAGKEQAGELDSVGSVQSDPAPAAARQAKPRASRCCTCSTPAAPVLAAYRPPTRPPTCIGTCQCRPPAPGPDQTATSRGAAAQQSKTSPASRQAGGQAGMVAVS